MFNLTNLNNIPPLLLQASNYLNLIIVIAIAFILFLLIIRNIRIVPQAKTFVIERLGTYHATWQTGIHAKIPFLDRIANVITLKERVADFDPQAVITKDNVTMQIDTVIFYQVVDSKLYTYGIENPILAIENLSATTLRNLIGDLELDETLTSRDVINTNMRLILDIATDPWGIKVNRVELKNIMPPREIQQAMERQMKAEREKREKILIAEGVKEATIREAEGDKQSVILRAEAKKEKDIREAEGEAQAILTIQEATARGLKMIKDVQPDEGLISLRALDTMTKVADGKATKILIPSNLQSLAGLAQVFKTVLSEPDPEVEK